MNFCVEGIHAIFICLASVEIHLIDLFCHVSEYIILVSRLFFTLLGSLICCQPPIGNMPAVRQFMKRIEAQRKTRVHSQIGD